MKIKNERVLKNLMSAKMDLIKTINDRIKIENLSERQALDLIKDLNDFDVHLRKYWM